MFLPCSSLALPLYRIGLVSCSVSVQEVSEPSLESPRPPMAVSRQGCRETSRFRLPSLHPCLLAAIPVRPPGGSPVACSLLARQLFAACSLLVFHHFLDFTKMICYAIVIIDLRIFTFCPKSQIFLNKLCLSNWLKIAGYMFSNISPPKEKRPHPYSGEVRPFFFFGGRCIELASPLRQLLARSNFEI